MGLDDAEPLEWGSDDRTHRALHSHQTRHSSLLSHHHRQPDASHPHHAFESDDTCTVTHAHSDTATIDAMAALNTQSPSPEHDKMVSVLTRHCGSANRVAAPPQQQRFSPRAVLAARCIGSALFIPPVRHSYCLEFFVQDVSELSQCSAQHTHARTEAARTVARNMQVVKDRRAHSINCSCVPRLCSAAPLQPRASTRPPSHFDCWISRWCSCICRPTR